MARVFALKGNIGVGHTDTYGTAVARTAFARFIDSDVQRSHGEEHVATSRNHAEEDANLGNYDVNVSGTIEARPETVGAFLKAFHGKNSVTTVQPDSVNSPTVRKHQIDVKDEAAPIDWERRLGTLAKSELVKSVVLEETTLEFAKNTLVLKTKGPGQKDEILAVPTVPTFDAKRALLKHECTVTLGGTTVGVQSARVTMQRFVEKQDYETGSRFRQAADVGAATITTEFEVAMRDAALLQRSLGAAAATEPQDDPLYNADKIKWAGPIIEDAFRYELEVDMPKTFWQPIGVSMRGKDPVTQRIRAKPLYDETAGYLWRTILQNTQATI